MAVVGLALVTCALHLLSALFLLYLLSQGMLQDADQWSIYSGQVIGQVVLVAVGSVVSAGAAILFVARGVGVTKLFSASFAAAALVLVASLLMGWSYWREMGSNIPLVVISSASVAFAVSYMATAGLFFGLSEGPKTS